MAFKFIISAKRKGKKTDETEYKQFHAEQTQEKQKKTTNL